ncbi:hypothetical protein [Marinobacter sp. SS21]|uniref:hypothetical protein n=1 Tax=Marinobacter sp. SS21 TaxID=2979460 RepID=UPI002330B082|nr:hypothetical protein [Marinobacter sp. SS21]MDC0662409.1 hypothetical protein [Marinobacter sp. SS21]
MKDVEMCRYLLALQPPWDVSRVRVDAQSREVHVYLTSGRSWFGRYLADTTQSRWRHTSLGACKAYIHASLPEQLSAQERQLPFLGDVSNEFSHGLARRVVGCLQVGMSYRQVCELLDIDVHLAWQIRHALSEGTLPGAGRDLAKRLHEEHPVARDEVTIPGSSDPVWRHILTAREPIQVRMLSLRLLLTRARQDFRQLRGEDARTLKINEIRRFFVKHEKQLAEEIAQIAELRDGVEEGLSQ